MPTIHLLIKGKVQGVFYRATAKRIAKNLGVKGWIRNTEEGDVEAVASAEKEILGQFETWCRSGPDNAQVNSVHITPLDEAVFNDFVIRH